MYMTHMFVKSTGAKYIKLSHLQNSDFDFFTLISLNAIKLYIHSEIILLNHYITVFYIFFYKKLLYFFLLSSPLPLINEKCFINICKYFIHIILIIMNYFVYKYFTCRAGSTGVIVSEASQKTGLKHLIF